MKTKFDLIKLSFIFEDGSWGWGHANSFRKSYSENFDTVPGKVRHPCHRQSGNKSTEIGNNLSELFI